MTDTTMPPDEAPTTRELPVIPAGHAEAAIAEAFAALAAAVQRAEAVANACARALDAGAAEGVAR